MKIQIHHAFIQEQGFGRLNVESRAVKDAMEQWGVPVTLFHQKKMLRRQVPLMTTTTMTTATATATTASGSFVCGDIPCCEAAMTQLGMTVPEPDDYPECLHEFLHRRIWRSTLRDLVWDFEQGRGRAVFVKPATRVKRFTGFVLEPGISISQAHGSSQRDPVYCSDVVTWRSEYRVYVSRGEILGILNYSGDKSVMIDTAVVERALACLRAAGKLRAGFAIDFGVLDNGATALVEMNDGYAIGNYGLDPLKYTEMLVNRWKELEQPCENQR